MRVIEVGCMESDLTETMKCYLERAWDRNKLCADGLFLSSVVRFILNGHAIPHIICQEMEMRKGIKREETGRERERERERERWWGL